MSNCERRGSEREKIRKQRARAQTSGEALTHNLYCPERMAAWSPTSEGDTDLESDTNNPETQDSLQIALMEVYGGNRPGELARKNLFANNQSGSPKTPKSHIQPTPLEIARTLARRK